MSRFRTSRNFDEYVNNMISLKRCRCSRFADTWDGKVVKILTSRLSSRKYEFAVHVMVLAYVMM